MRIFILNRPRTLKGRRQLLDVCFHRRIGPCLVQIVLFWPIFDRQFSRAFKPRDPAPKTGKEGLGKYIVIIKLPMQRVTQTQQRWCALPIMMSSMFGTEQCISKRSSAAPSKLGATHVRPKLWPGAAAPAPCPPQPAPVRRRRTFVDCVYNYIHVARRGNLVEDCIFLTLFISLLLGQCIADLVKFLAKFEPSFKV